MRYLFILMAVLFTAACGQPAADTGGVLMGRGQMPAAVAASSGEVQVVYGQGDSIMLATLKRPGDGFGRPVVAAVLPGLAASHGRGPQVAYASGGLCMIACNNAGDIFSWRADSSGKWSQPRRINDADTVAKEGFTALAADGDMVFAVWLDMRDGHNKIYGARSADGGRSWLANRLIYASPDTTVCECCKPSVVVRGNNVYVMFRNWLGGNRDMYLISSADGGENFGQAQKLGNGSWKLEGCPVDGGALLLNDDGSVETVWQRDKKLFSCKPGQAEQELGAGRTAAIAGIRGSYAYAWVSDGEVVCVLPGGRKEVMGKGKQPLLQAAGRQHVVCVWERDKQIFTRIISLQGD